MALTDKSLQRDPLELPVELKVNGEYMRAFLVSYSSFSKDPLIPDEKKRIENYQIEFRQQGDVYFVLFFAKRKANETELDGGESELGKDVIYTISKKDFRIVAQKFFK